MQRFKAHFREMCRCQRGATALIVGIIFVPILIGIAALAIDLTKAQTGSSKNMGAIDAAAQAAAEMVQKSQSSYLSQPNTSLNNFPVNLDATTEYAYQIYLQNNVADQSSAIPIPPGGGENAFTAIYDPATSKVKIHACETVANNIAPAAGMNGSEIVCADSDAPVPCAEYTKTKEIPHYCPDGKTIDGTITKVKKFRCDIGQFVLISKTETSDPKNCLPPPCIPGDPACPGVCQPSTPGCPQPFPKYCETYFDAPGQINHNLQNAITNGGLNDQNEKVSGQIATSGIYANFAVNLLKTYGSNMLFHYIDKNKGTPNGDTINDKSDCVGNSNCGFVWGHYYSDVAINNTNNGKRYVGWGTFDSGNGQTLGKEDEFQSCVDVNATSAEDSNCNMGKNNGLGGVIQQSPAPACSGLCPTYTAKDSQPISGGNYNSLQSSVHAKIEAWKAPNGNKVNPKIVQEAEKSLDDAIKQFAAQSVTNWEAGAVRVSTNNNYLISLIIPPYKPGTVIGPSILTISKNICDADTPNPIVK